ncbi:MAG TPA: PilZ domain-containing protein [Holophaga sp.]|nr:PilZ domain-containing protein [Holophaga sp.]
MKLPFLGPEPSGALAGPALEQILDELCERKQPLLLATPYLQHESRFLERSGRELTVRIAMSREAVRHGLGQQPLRLRFAWALTMYCGATRILDYIQEENRRCLVLEQPARLVLDEQRKAFRVDQVGPSQGALSSDDGTILKVTLEDISILGARVFCMEALPGEKFQAGRHLTLSLSLDRGPALICGARICHGADQSLGLVFVPPLAGPALQSLSEWIAPRAEELRRRWENRAELRARAEQQARPKAPPSGVLLMTSREDLRDQLAAALEGALPLRTVIPAAAPFKETLAEPPLVLIVDARNEGLEGRFRLRTILEALPVNAPTIVLGSRESEGGKQLARELRGALYLDWNPLQSVFFRRRLQRLIQDRWKGEA